MRLLDRYLLRELSVPLGYCLGGFLIFWISFDLIFELDTFQRNKLRGIEIAEYYALRMPDFLVLIGPIGLLLALLYTLTNHARHNELTAMRAAGISMWRLCLPYLVMGVAVSGGLSFINEFIAPQCSVMAKQVMESHQPKRLSTTVSFHNAAADRQWFIESYNKETSELIRPRVVWNLTDGSRREINAERGGRVGNQWVFFDVLEITYSNRVNALGVQTTTSTLYLPEFTETPAQIESELKINNLSSIRAARSLQLSVPEIVNYIRLHPELSPRDHALLYTQLHARLAMPWTAIVVVLIAIPFGAVSGRRNAFVGVASSVIICFAFFVISRFGMALGTGGTVEPWLAAWSPNLLFGVTGLVLILRMR